MIRATIGWCGNEYYIYTLSTGEALLFSSPSVHGDGSWQIFDSNGDALVAAGLGKKDIVKDKGEVLFNKFLIEEIRSVQGEKFLPGLGHPLCREKGYVGQEEYLLDMRSMLWAILTP